MSFKKNLLAFFIIGIAGTLSHFVYKWSGENFLIGLFFPVNESVWEHLKLLFFPAAIYFAVEYLLLSEKPQNFLPSAIKAIFCGMLTIIVLFYTINGIIGKNIDFINISIYFISIIVTLSKKNKSIRKESYYSSNIVLLLSFFFILTAILFLIWSYNPPELGIFVPPMQ